MGASSGSGYIYPTKYIYDHGYTKGFVTKDAYSSLSEADKAKAMEGCLNFNRLATQQRPFFAVPWGNIGFVLLQQGDSDKAIAALQKAIKYDPNFVQAMATLGSAHFSRGELDDALPLLKKAVELQPMFGPAWNNLALVHAERGEWAEADACVKKALETGYEVPQAFSDEIAENLK